MIELIKNGTITSAKGFVAGGISAGIKISSENNLDLGVSWGTEVQEWYGEKQYIFYWQQIL